MFTIEEAGGVRLYAGDNSWGNEGGMIGKSFAEFDPDVYWPCVSGTVFLLPKHRGQRNYQIHLLETGALVLKEGCAFLCTHINEKPRVIEFVVKSTQSDAASSII